MNMIKKEAFNWTKVPEGLDSRYLVEIVAKTPGITDHTQDLALPLEERVKRVYTETELREAARSLAYRSININHDTNRTIEGAFVVMSKWNKGEVQTLCYIPNDDILKRLRSGEIKEVSITDYTWEDVPLGKDEVKMEGIVFTALSLVEPPFTAGDPNTSINPLFEGMYLKCEIVGIKMKGEPFGEYSSFQDCVSKNQDKGDPEGYCATIERNIQGEAIPPEKTVEKVSINETPPASPPTSTIDPKDTRIKELEDAVGRLTTTVEDIKKSHNIEISKVLKDEKDRLLSKIENIIPPLQIQRQGVGGVLRLSQELRRILYEERNQ